MTSFQNIEKVSRGVCGHGPWEFLWISTLQSPLSLTDFHKMVKTGMDPPCEYIAFI